MTDKPITLEAALRQVIDQLDGPTPIDEVVRRVLSIRPSSGKNPVQQIRNNMRYMYYRPNWVWLDRQTLLPMRLCMNGVRFRITPSPAEVERRLVYAYPAFHPFHRDEVAWTAVQLTDINRKVLRLEPLEVEELHQFPFGEEVVRRTGFHLGSWFDRVGFRAGDSILATVLDWDQGRFQIEHEPAGQRRSDEIVRRNQELADLLYDVLEEAADELVFDRIAVPTAYARMKEPGGYPGDHWTEVIRQDRRMAWLDYQIRYADYLSPFTAELFDKPLPERPSFTPEQGQQVYRFRAALKHRPGLWRVVEILGKQTLVELDDALRSAFEHDHWDHMSGFWRKVRRGQTKRFREIDLGNINPLGEGEYANLPIAAMGLQLGEQLKYVYDFGDWVEHTLTLEAIVEPEEGVTYPRLAEQNKPRYRYCESCRDKGRKTTAMYICIDCSNRQQREVLLCDSCASEEHEDHYVDELLY